MDIDRYIEMGLGNISRESLCEKGCENATYSHP